MTSHKYLSKKKGAAYTFFSGVHTAVAPAAIIALLELLFFAIAPAVSLGIKKENLGKNTSARLSDSIKFFTSILEEKFLTYAFLAVLAVLSIAAAVVLLRFMADKRTVNVYYSLGIKRRTLFLSRWFSGAVMLTVPPVIAVVAGFVVNIIYLKLSWQLSIVLLHIFFGLWIFSLLCYTVSAAVFSSVGTVSEGIVYSVGVLAFPTVVLFSLQLLMTAFIPAAAFGSSFRTFGSSDYFADTVGQTLVAQFSRYNPVTFFADELTKYSCCTIKESSLILGDSSQFTFPNLGISMFWFPVIVAVAAIGCIFFVRRNAENCGFLNTNKVLSNAVLFELIVAAVAMPLSEIDFYSLGQLFATGAIAAFAVYILFEIFLKRNFLRIVKSLYKFAAHAAAVAIIIGIFSTGLFGYASYVPDSADVKAAAVALPAEINTLDINTNSYLSMIYDENPFLPLQMQYGYSELPAMTDENDIKAMTQLHKKLTADNTDKSGSIASVTFRYVLKSGRTESRKVFVKSEALLREALGLFTAAACRAQYENLLGTDWSKLKNDNGKFISFEDAVYGAFVYENATVEFYPMSMHESCKLSLTKEDFYTIKDAVKKDMLAQTAADMFDRTSKPLGVLVFDSGDRSRVVEGMTGFYEESVSVSVSETAEPGDADATAVTAENESPDAPDVPDMQGEEAAAEKPDKSAKIDRYANSLSEIYGTYNPRYSVIVTEKMTNTVAAIKNAGLEEIFSSKLYSAPKSVSFIKLDFSTLEIRFGSNSNSVSRDMTAAVPNSESAYNYETGEPMSLSAAVKIYAENTVTDAAKINEAMSKVALRSFARTGDYICVADYGDGHITCYPLPSADAPSFVTGYTYTAKTSYFG